MPHIEVGGYRSCIGAREVATIRTQPDNFMPTPALTWPLLLALAPQGGKIIRGPSTAMAGTSVVVEVASNAPSVEVSFGTGQETSTIPIPPGGKVTIPIPSSAVGTMTVSIGTGSSRQCLNIEVAAPNESAAAPARQQVCRAASPRLPTRRTAHNG